MPHRRLGPETDKNGSFELEARVPRLSAGSHTITVEDGSPEENSVTETFDVVTTAVVSTPEEVFGVLGDSLVSVWSLDNATKAWSAYFPGAPEGVSDLAGVSRGDIVWINVSADVDFQGSSPHHRLEPHIPGVTRVSTPNGGHVIPAKAGAGRRTNGLVSDNRGRARRPPLKRNGETRRNG